MKRLSLPLLFLLILLAGAGDLFGQEAGGGGLKHELGFWIGASSPVAGTPVDNVLQSTIGGGGFYRINWPWVFYTEFGSSYSVYFSRTTQKLEFAPVYGALAYRLPIPMRLNVFLKAGGGAAHLVIRPDNLQGWEPMAYGGLEFSLQASKRLRIGLRLDYELVYENGLQDSQQRDLAYTYYFVNRDPSQSIDPRFFPVNRSNGNNGSFFQFGLMISFIL